MLLDEAVNHSECKWRLVFAALFQPLPCHTKECFVSVILDVSVSLRIRVRLPFWAAAPTGDEVQ